MIRAAAVGRVVPPVEVVAALERPHELAHGLVRHAAAVERLPNYTEGYEQAKKVFQRDRA